VLLASRRMLGASSACSSRVPRLTLRRRARARRTPVVYPPAQRARLARRALRPQPRLALRALRFRREARTSLIPPTLRLTAARAVSRRRSTTLLSSTTPRTRSACAASATGTQRARAHTRRRTRRSRRRRRARCGPRAGRCATNTRWRASPSSAARTRSHSSAFAPCPVCFARALRRRRARHYQDAYAMLVMMFGSAAMLPPRTKRWAEAKVLADCINVKVRPASYTCARARVLTPPHCADLQAVPVQQRARARARTA
jgi:hypothetical protein